MGMPERRGRRHQVLEPPRAVIIFLMDFYRAEILFFSEYLLSRETRCRFFYFSLFGYDKPRRPRAWAPPRRISDEKNAKNNWPRRACEEALRRGILALSWYRFSSFRSEQKSTYNFLIAKKEGLPGLFITDLRFFQFPDFFENLTDIIPYLFTAWFDLQCPLE
jgi:hypothetical protein